MSLPIPLAVRIATSRRDLHVTRCLRDLAFRETAVGGYASATLAIDRPVGLAPEDVEHWADVYVYDQTAAVVWQGRLEDLGVEVGSAGQVWRITCMGPAAHASDVTLPLIYVDKSPTPWFKNRNASQEQQTATVNAGDDPGGSAGEALVLTFPTGLDVATGDLCTALYLGLEDAGQKMAVFDYAWDAGIGGSWQVRALSSSTGGVIRSETSSTSGSSGSTAIVGVTTNFTFGDDRAYIQFRWTGGASSTGTAGTTWLSVLDITVRAVTYNKSGTEITSYTSGDKTILASEVVADLLGRVLEHYDGANASIDTTTYAITQLSYPDGVTARQVLDDLIELEPGYRWGAYEANSAGKYRFEWTAWPTTVRYEADVVDGYDAPSSAGDVYNAVRVFYKDSLNRSLSTLRTSTVNELDDISLTRTAKVDLPASSTSADTTQVGDQFLAEHARPPAAGTLRVARPILDLVDARWVWPWQIRAGELIRVRGVQPRVSALTATVRDGVSVFRIASREFQAGSASAVLELDEYSVSTARALATNARKRRRK